MANPTQKRKSFTDELADFSVEAVLRKKRAIKDRGLEVFDFSVGDPVEPTDSRIIEAFRQAVPEVSQYPSISGLEEFRGACTAWMARRFGVTLNGDRQILPSSGSKEAIFHLPLCVLDRGSERRRILFGIPGYPIYERGAKFAGATPWGVRLDPSRGYRLEPWNLDAGLISETAIMWINYPHNPTGATVDLAYLKDLVAFTQERSILLASDECYADIYFGQPPPSVLQASHTGVVVFQSLSKRSGMTGYRSGFIAGDAEVIDQLRRVRAYFGVASSVMVQKAATLAWLDETHAEARRALFRAKRNLLVKFFAEVGLECSSSDATIYVWVRTPESVESTIYAQHLAEFGILVSPARHFGSDEPYVRLALVPSLADCERAVAHWRKQLETQ